MHKGSNSIKPALLAAACLCIAILCGCGGSTTTDNNPPPPPPATTFQGQVNAGTKAVSGADIALYATGTVTTGPVNLLASTAVVTDSSGKFSSTYSFQCPSSTTQVYAVARGGNPDLASGTNNAALVLMSPLGNCGNVSSTTVYTVNEVTTAASAWALSQFVGPDAAVNSSSTNAKGMANAFQIAQNLVNTTTGAAPGSGLPSGAVAETSKINTLANILASCSQSNGTTACTTLFSAAAAGGTEPQNTLDVAIDIVHNPAVKVSALFALAASGAGFSPALTAAPHDWTLSITYSGGGLNQPGDIAVDSNGDIWAANYFGAVVSEFLPTGAPASTTGYAGTGLLASFGIAIDSSDNVWVANENSVSAAKNSDLGSISKFSTTGAELSGAGYTGGGIYYPQGIAADSSGNIWIADYGHSSASLLNNSGTAISGANGFATFALPFTPAVAVDGSGNAWFAVQQAAARVTPTGTVTKFSCCDDPAGIAVDPSGNLWLADYGGASVVKLTSTGTVAADVESPNGTDAPQGIAVDGAGNVFAANFRGDSITELTGSTAAVLSPANGFGKDATLSEPIGIALDASGNLWVSNAGNNTITQFVGLGSPVKTPLAGPPATP
jgi:streptogramin lyase